jgi:hypothetical protein
VVNDRAEGGDMDTMRGKHRRVRLFGTLAAGVFALLVLAAPAALAYPDPPAAPPVDHNTPVGIRVEGASASAQHASEGLAFTGGDIAGLVTIGAVLVGLGTLTIVVSRRRAHPALS